MRTPTHYLVSSARWLRRVSAAATLLAMAGAWAAGSDGGWRPVGVEFAQRWVVRRPPTASLVAPQAPLASRQHPGPPTPMPGDPVMRPALEADRFGSVPAPSTGSRGRRRSQCQGRGEAGTVALLSCGDRLSHQMRRVAPSSRSRMRQLARYRRSRARCRPSRVGRHTGGASHPAPEQPILSERFP